MSATDLFAQVEAGARELFEERAAIREFDGKQSRAEAEQAAAAEVERFKQDCYRRYFLDLAPRQQMLFLMDVRKHQGIDGLAQAISFLPESRRADAVTWAGKTFGPEIKGQLRTKLGGRA